MFRNSIICIPVYNTIFFKNFCSKMFIFKKAILFVFQLSKQLESFKTYLEDFATKHRNDIRKSAEFRSQFQQMCAAIGVDPLACNSFLNISLNYLNLYT